MCGCLCHQNGLPCTCRCVGWESRWRQNPPSKPTEETDEPTIDVVRAGLKAHYRVEKISDPTGRHADCRYFVLDPAHDPIALAALAQYAEVARDDGHSALADDLDRWVREIREADRG